LLGREESYSIKNQKSRHIEIASKDGETPELNVVQRPNINFVQIKSINAKGKRCCLAVGSKRFANISSFILQ